MIPHLEDLSIGHRIAITLCLVLAILFSLALFGYLTGAWDQAEGQITLVLPPSKWDDKLIELDKQALELAYVEKIKSLFIVWVSSGLESPERPMKGAAQARRGYIEVMQALERRKELQHERK